MKRLYFVVMTFMITAFAFSQTDVSIKSSIDSLDYTNGSTTITGHSDAYEIGGWFYVVNNSSSTIKVRYGREVISNPNGFLIQLCDASGYCFNTSGEYWTSQGNLVNVLPGDSSKVKLQVSTLGQEGEANVIYHVLDESEAELASVTVKFTNSTSSIKVNNKSTFKIFPNPMQDVVTINGDAIKNGGTVVFTDALGKEVKRTVLNSGSSSVNVAELRRGVYFVNVYNKQGDKSAVQRVIKQ